MNVMYNSLGLVALLVSGSLMAATPLKPMDVFDLESASEPRISPDGERVVYVRNFADVMSDQRFTSLWIVNTDGSGHRPILAGKHQANSPRWSPDGSRLAFISNHEGSPQIYVRWMDTGDTAAVTSETLPPSNLSWSPDGKQIAFTRLVADEPLVIGHMPAPPPGAQWAEPPKFTDQIAFRFDQVGEIPRGYMHFFVVPAEGGKARQVSQGPRQFGVGSYVWAPEGESLVFSANLDEGAEMFHALDTEIWEITLADGSYEQLTDRRGPDGSPVGITGWQQDFVRWIRQPISGASAKRTVRCRPRWIQCENDFCAHRPTNPRPGPPRRRQPALGAGRQGHLCSHTRQRRREASAI